MRTRFTRSRAQRLSLCLCCLFLTTDLSAQQSGGGILPGSRGVQAGGTVTGPIRLPDGTTGAPSLTFTSDTTKGLWFLSSVVQAKGPFTFTGVTTFENVEIYRTTTNSLYVQSSSGLTIDANATTSGTAVRGRSSSGTGVAAQSLSAQAITGTQTGNLTGNTNNPALQVSRDHVLGGFTSTGAMIYVSDTSGSTAELMRLAYGGVDKFNVTNAGNLTTTGSIHSTEALGTSLTNYITGQFGVGGPPHSNVLNHAGLDVTFSCPAATTSCYGMVLYPTIIPLAGSDRGIGFFEATIIDVPAGGLTYAAGQFMGIVTNVNHGGTATNMATLMIDGAPIYAGTTTNGPFAIQVISGNSLFGGPLWSSTLATSAGRMFFSSTAPTISSGFGGTPSIVANSGTAAFTINVGTGGAATTGVIGLPTATTGWRVSCDDVTTQSATVYLTKQTATSTTTATIGNFDAAGAAAAWVASNILVCHATAY